MTPDVLLRFSRAFTFLLLAVLIYSASAQNRLISLTTRRDMVFDHAGNYLYISTSDGLVRRYNISVDQFDFYYNLGGSLFGLDIASDDSFLLVAQGVMSGPQGTFHRLDLGSGNATNINYTRNSTTEEGAWDVAIGSNNLALVTTQGLGDNPVRQIDLTTNVIAARSDVPNNGINSRVEAKTAILRSADATRMYLLQPGISSGPVFTYSATSNTFGALAKTDHFFYGGAAINRHGSVVATLIGNVSAFDTAATFTYLRSFAAANAGMAFDAVRDRFYAVNRTSDEIIAFDANTYREIYRLDIGEDITGVAQFGTGILVASHDGRFLALETASGIRLFTLPSGPYPPPAAPVFASPRDLIFDHAGHRLYITTAAGLVWPYDRSTGTLGTPYDLGGELLGADVAADDSFLLVAQHESGVAEGSFQKLDLATGAVMNLNYTRRGSEAGAWDVAICSNGLALGSTDYNGSGSVPLHQIDLATNAVTTRNDVPYGTGLMQAQQAQIHRSAGGTRLYFLERLSNGSVFTYSAISNTFGALAYFNDDLSQASAAVSRDGSLLATRFRTDGASLHTTSNFGLVYTFPTFASGVAFDALNDIVYGIAPYLSQIIAYDTNTFAERFRFDIGEPFTSGATPFGRGLLVASPDGRNLALNTGTEVRVYDTPAVPLLSVVSLKNHGGAAFAIDLPLNGPRAVESRSGGGNGAHTVGFTFGQDLVAVDGAAVTSGTGNVMSGAIDAADPRRYVVNLTGVSDRQTVRITLSGVGDAAGNQTALISAQMGVLLGDTNGNGAVNASDVSETKAQSGQPLSGANFRSDANVSGAINASDIGLVKGHAGMSLPAAGERKR